VTDRELIRQISRAPHQRATYKQLVHELGLGGGRDRRLLLEHLARLTMSGALVKLDRELWQLPQKSAAPAGRNSPNPQSQNVVVGRLDLHRDGYGFVRPANATGRDDDIFIPPPALGSAMQNDQVAVELDRGSSGSRKSGRILRVLTRRNTTVVGIFHYGSDVKAARRRRGNIHPSNRARQQQVEDRFAVPAGFHWVTPLDERMTQPILIAFGDELPASVASTPHRTIDKRVARTMPQPDPDAAAPDAALPDWSEIDLEGLAVDIEVTDFPTTTRPARGRVLEVLGDPEDFGVDVEIVIRKHHLPHIFPSAVLQEARRAAEITGDSAHRRDFRHLPIVTIDGETARDFDDAVLVRQLPNGLTELQVHIADVAHYVQPGSALDNEARLRATSVYFPDRAVPMLPHELSSGACSLLPHEDRFVLSAILHFDQEGNRVSYEITKGIIRSAARMTYNQVHAIIEPSHPLHTATRIEFVELAPQFDRMYAFARLLNKRRQQRGSIDFDLPEPSIEFDEQGTMRTIVATERSWANRLIEEFMLAANEAVASHLEQLAVPSLYRIHEKPNPAKIMEFEESAASFGYSLGVGNIPVRRFEVKGDKRDHQRSGARHSGGRGQQSRQPSRALDIPQDIAITPQMYQKLAAKISGTPEERILAYLMLRSLKQARYSEKNEGHFALAADSYTHFTSPIRRYPDLIVHRILTAILEDESAAPIPEEELASIAQESSDAERRADEAERELLEWKKIRFMEERIGEHFDAIILSVTKYGFFVELKSLFIEGLVPLQSLSDLGERFTFRENTRQMIGEHSGRRFAIGDRVRVLLDKIQRAERKLIFAVLDEDPLPQPLQHAPHKQPSVGAQAMSPERSGKRKKISGQQSAKKANFAKGKNKKSRRRK
jgi:ribonuclease R